jgi:hypothetical protein
MKLDDGHEASLDVLADEACKAKGISLIIEYGSESSFQGRLFPVWICRIPTDQAGMEQGWIIRHKKGTAAIRSVSLGVADLVGRGDLKPPVICLTYRKKILGVKLGGIPFGMLGWLKTTLHADMHPEARPIIPAGATSFSRNEKAR